MTTKEFKDKYPQYKNLEGNSLWNMMENTLLIEQRKKPKKYQLRWLFYRGKKNFVLGKNDHTSSQTCDKCRKGVSNYLSIFDFGGSKVSISFCPHCGKEMKPVPNTNFNHKLWKIYKKLEDAVFNTLDFLHIMRNTISKNRYEMFSDESYFVKSEKYDNNWNFKERELRSRKWWEYIIIEKR